jgi:hypothetical protein
MGTAPAPQSSTTLAKATLKTPASVAPRRFDKKENEIIMENQKVKVKN